MSTERDELASIEPMWEAMDCEDVTDDPFYADFTSAEPTL